MDEFEELTVKVLIAAKKHKDLRRYGDWSALSKFQKIISKELKEHFYKPKQKTKEEKPGITEIPVEHRYKIAKLKSHSLRTADDWHVIDIMEREQ